MKLRYGMISLLAVFAGCRPESRTAGSLVDCKTITNGMVYTVPHGTDTITVLTGVGHALSVDTIAITPGLSIRLLSCGF